MRFGVEFSVMRLYNGRRSFFAVFSFGRRSFWLQRWDTARSPRNRFRSGDMGWTWGKR